METPVVLREPPMLVFVFLGLRRLVLIWLWPHSQSEFELCRIILSSFRVGSIPLSRLSLCLGFSCFIDMTNLDGHSDLEKEVDPDLRTHAFSHCRSVQKTNVDTF